MGAIIQQVLNDMVCEKLDWKVSLPALVYATFLDFSPIPQEKIKLGLKIKWLNKQKESNQYCTL